jgi:periplasmic divalent cation tolerance protein
MDSTLLVLTNAPDREVALRLADGLVAARLAACVNLLSECTSVYRWKGAVETAAEIPVLIKTRAGLFREVEAFILDHHPYNVPEVIAVSVERGSPAYLEWLNRETQPEMPDADGSP